MCADGHAAKQQPRVDCRYWCVAVCCSVLQCAPDGHTASSSRMHIVRLECWSELQCVAERAAVCTSRSCGAAGAADC